VDGYYEGEHHFTKIERLSNPDRADEVRAAHQRMSPHLEDGAGETVRLAMSGNYWPHALADQGVILFRSPREETRAEDVPGIYWDSTWVVNHSDRRRRFA